MHCQIFLTKTKHKDVSQTLIKTLLYLHFIYPLNDVKHFLEDSLQGEIFLQAAPASTQKILEVVPEPQDIVFPRINPFSIMVPLCLQLLRQGHQGLYTLLICSNVCLNGIVLFLCCFYCR